MRLTKSTRLLTFYKSRWVLFSKRFATSHDDDSSSFLTSTQSFPSFLFNFRSRILSSFRNIPASIISRRFISIRRSCFASSALSSLLTNTNLSYSLSLLMDSRISRLRNLFATVKIICPCSSLLIEADTF